MAKKKYLNLYNDWVKAGEMPSNGLCMSLSNHGQVKEFRELFEPTDWEINDLEMLSGHWLTSIEEFMTFDTSFSDFNPMRQNVILLLAAMNNEL